MLRASLALLLLGISAAALAQNGRSIANGNIVPKLQLVRQVQDTRGHNKAACALANKLARICYATLRDKTPFGETERLNRKITRESFVMPG